MPEDQMCDDFVKEFLQNYDINLEKDDVGTKADQISRKIEETKSEFCKKLDSKFEECSQSMQQAEVLHKKVEILNEKAENVKYDILREITLVKELSPIGIDSLETKLERIDKTLIILNYLKSLNKELLDFKEHFDAKRYLCATKTSKIIKNIKDSSTSNEIFEQSKLKEAKHFQMLNKMEEQLNEKLLLRLNELFEMKIPQISKESDTITITFSNQVDARLWSEVSKSMHQLNILGSSIKKLSNELLLCVFETVLSDHCEMRISDGCLSIKRQSGIFAPNLTTSRKVIGNMKELIIFLGQGLKSEDEDGNSCMELIGNNISQRVFHRLNIEVVEKVIPESSKEFGHFKKLMSLLEDCQITAQEFKFLPCAKDQFLMRNSEVAFVKKNCENILLKARTMLKEPLHVTMDVGDEFPKEFEEASGMESLAKVALTPLFNFPRCQISSSVHKVWRQLENFMADLSGNNLGGMEEVAVRFYETCRKVLQLFVCVVPLHHQKDIQSLPLLPAVHHNNCLYLSHKSLELERRLKEVFPKLPPASSFLDFAVSLRSMGVSSLKHFISQQKDEISEDLRLQIGYENIGEGENSKELDRSVDKVSVRLRHLNNIWSDVLPSLCQKLIGTLLDSCFVEVMRNIIQLEDISEADGQQFVLVISKLEELGNELFPANDSCKLPALKCIESWIKMKEFKFVLNARLIEIGDRWASGKGPLAEEFTSEELDHLIRALFQNTDMRSAVLATINC